jgi:RNA polymerase sigma factor (sigma-70 family)
MTKAQASSAIRNVQMIFAVGTVAGWTDKELLEQSRSPDRPSRELAFTALIERHGPMVLRTCRSILHDQHAAEDAFQATFVVLLRKARSLWARESLGPWLHQVATRVASGMRSGVARQRRLERRTAKPGEFSESGAGLDDFAPAIHQELDRLPQRYRAPILLCCLEGLTREQAASRLGWPMGTLQSRLARGRERLKGRLTKRGIAPGAAVATALLSQQGVRAAVPGFLVESTVQTAVEFLTLPTAVAGATSIAVTKLAEGVLKTMFIHKLKTLAGALLAAGLVSTGVGVWAGQRPAAGSFSDPDQVSQIQDATNVTTAADREPISQAEAPEPGGPTEGGADFEIDPEPGEPNADESGVSLKYHDSTPDGKKSLGGSGQMIQFSGQSATTRVTGLRVHGSRYGNPQAPKESFLIYFLSLDQKRVLHTELAPYSVFERGPEEWVKINFERPIELPQEFWVVLDFRAHQTKGVFVSYDTSSGGKHSRQGLPGIPSSPLRFGGDWMVEAMVGD